MRRLWVLFFLMAGMACMFAQEIVVLDEAIANSMNYLAGRLPKGDKVVVLNVSAGTKELSDYVIEELTAHIVNNGNLTVVDRRNLELLQQEMNFQMSGEVNEATAQEIGMKLGAQTIISGSISPLGDVYRMRVQAIQVETAQIQGIHTATVELDAILAALLKVKYNGVKPRAAQGSSSESGSSRSRSRNSGGATPPAKDAWKHNWLYLGARLGGSVGFYTPASDWSGGDLNAQVSFDFSAQIAVQIVRQFAVQMEFLFTSDKMDIEYKDAYWDDNYKLTSHSLLIPILAKYTARPGNFSIQGFGGLYFTVPLGQMEVGWSYYSTNYGSDSGSDSFDFTAPVGFMIGGNFGIKLGPGVLFLDLRYAGDFSDTKISEDGESEEIYHRGKFLFSLGYELGLIRK
ncbi:MAG: outer membrane beta-barrel protein [Treponema sp.]|jgi:TolB-like protein|nr:outer membrane beta-barrel protein [Treponema sp.]